MATWKYATKSNKFTIIHKTVFNKLNESKQIKSNTAVQEASSHLQVLHTTPLLAQRVQ